MNSVSKKLYRIMIVIVLLSVVFSPELSQIARAQIQPEEQSLIDQKLDLAADFFGTAIDRENFFAPFDDFFDQNACVRRDIFALNKERDQIGSIVRKAILNPDISVNEVQLYQREWELVSAEIYLLRNYELLLENNELKLRSEIATKYPNNSLISANLNRLFRKYNNKLDSYNKCQPTWAAITTKYEQIKINLARSINDLRTAWDDLGTEGQATLQSLRDSYNRLLETKENILAGNFSQFIAIDPGPGATYLDQSKNYIKNIGSLTDKVENELQQNENLDLVSLAERAVNLSGSLDQSVIADLNELNDRLTYGHADLVLNSVWDEAQRTTENITTIEALISANSDLSLTKKLTLINDRQCRESE